MKEGLKTCEMYSDNPNEYVRVALAIETLAYHNKNYLTHILCDDAHRSEEIQALLMESIKNQKQ